MFERAPTATAYRHREGADRIRQRRLRPAAGARKPALRRHGLRRRSRAITRCRMPTKAKRRTPNGSTAAATADPSWCSKPLSQVGERRTRHIFIVQAVDIDARQRAEAELADRGSRAGTRRWKAPARAYGTTTGARASGSIRRMWKVMRGYDPDEELDGSVSDVDPARPPRRPRARSRDYRQAGQRQARLQHVRLSRAPPRRPLDVDPEPRQGPSNGPRPASRCASSARTRTFRR